MQTLPSELIGDIGHKLSAIDMARLRLVNREISQAISTEEIQLSLKMEADEWAEIISVTGLFYHLDDTRFARGYRSLAEIGRLYGFLDDPPPDDLPPFFQNIEKWDVAKWDNDPTDDFVYKPNLVKLNELGDLILPYHKVTLVRGYHHSLIPNTTNVNYSVKQKIVIKDTSITVRNVLDLCGHFAYIPWYHALTEAQVLKVTPDSLKLLIIPYPILKH